MQKKIAVILLVEDSPADQVTVERALEDARVNCSLLTVENGEQALRLLRSEPPYDNCSQYPKPDLVLLDINMPVLDGPTTLKHIRSDTILHKLPVIMLTTSDQPEDVNRSYAAGANAYVTKPVKNEDFVKAIHKLENFWFQLVTLPQ